MLYDKERLDAAYAKVGLFADTAWAVNDADGYYKANQNLWRQTCALKEPCEKLGKPRSVLDTIPESRLAGYGNYLYDEQREKQYWGEYERPNYPQCDKTPISTNNEDIWCTENVEKIFNILTNPYTKTSELEKRCLEVINNGGGASSSSSVPGASSAPKKEQLAIEYNVEENRKKKKKGNRKKDDHEEDEKKENADGKEDDADGEEEEGGGEGKLYKRNIHNEPPRGTAKNFSELVLQMQLHSEEIRALWERNSQYSLNVNVPEFYPKQASDNYGHHHINNSGVSQTEPEAEMEAEQISVSEAEQPSICEYETVLVPSLIPWLNYSYPLRSLDFREINYLANEFQNLIMNDRSSSTSQTNFQPSEQTSTATNAANASPSAAEVLENVQTPSLTALAPTTTTIQQSTSSSSSAATITTTPTIVSSPGQVQVQTTIQHQEQQQQQQQQQPTRRLYSAVLQNQTSDTNVTKTPSVDEFEELEREALEQYRPSTENLRRASTDSIISAKYQELERLALEQYNSASSTDTSAGGQGNECNPLHEPPCGGKMSPYAALLLANSVLVGFYRSVVNTRLLTNLYTNVSRYR